MKVIKAKVYFIRDGGGTHYSGGYPACWQAEHYPFLVYADEEIETGGRTYRWIYATIPDEDLAEMLKDPQCITCTKEEACLKGNQYIPSKESVNDQQKVTLILAKIGRGEVLTQEDKDALNPDHPSKGIGRRKNAEQIWNDYAVTW